MLCMHGRDHPFESLYLCVAFVIKGYSLIKSMFSDLKSVSVEGDGVADVETLLRRVSYGDARAFPTPGRRNVHVATTIT